MASFVGNIGVNANHQGFYNLLRSRIGDFKVSQFEIREKFWGTSAFDDDFAAVCNSHDLVVFGGE